MIPDMMQSPRPRGSRAILIATALGASMQLVGLARGAPQPMTQREQRLVDPPMPDLLPALVPEPVKRLVDRLGQDAGDRAAIEAARLRRAAKAERQSRGCWHHKGAIMRYEITAVVLGKTVAFEVEAKNSRGARAAARSDLRRTDWGAVIVQVRPVGAVVERLNGKVG